jgi:hypothetical protein
MVRVFTLLVAIIMVLGVTLSVKAETIGPFSLTPASPSFEAHNIVAWTYVDDPDLWNFDLSGFGSNIVSIALKVDDYYPPYPDDYDLYWDGSFLGNTISPYDGYVFDFDTTQGLHSLRVEYTNRYTGWEPSSGGSWYDLWLDVVTVPETGDVTGTVTLQGNTDHSALITFEVRQPGTTAISANGTNDEDSGTPGTQITTGVDGSYTIIGVAAGTYDVTAKGSKWLRQKQENVAVTPGGTTVADFLSLKGGDANNTNSVNVLDLNILKSSYGKSQGTPGYDDRADFNKTNSVNVLDLNILKSNYGKSGAP